MTPAHDLTIKPAVPADAQALAALHGAILPSSRLSLFGPSYLACCYRYLISSPDEVVFVARSAESVAGGSFLSLAPQSLSRRLATRTPLLLELALRPLGRGARQIYADLLHPTPRAPDLPELAAIFVAPDQQGRGIGEAICRAIEAELTQRRIDADAYVVHTERDPGNRAIGFYRRLGFVLAEPANTQHRLMRLSKSLP